MTNKNPSFYTTGRTISVKLPSDVSASLATYRREMHPEMTDEDVAEYLIRDSLIRLGVLPLPEKDRGKVAGKR